jgi:hypothetical protein
MQKNCKLNLGTPCNSTQVEKLCRIVRNGRHFIFSVRYLRKSSSNSGWFDQPKSAIPAEWLDIHKFKNARVSLKISQSGLNLLHFPLVLISQVAKFCSMQAIVIRLSTG